MSMASMQSEKIRVMDGKDTFEFGAYENTGAKKTYVFNGQTVEETYAGPGKKLNTTRASITLVPIHISRYICRMTSVIHLACILFQLARFICLVVTSVKPTLLATYTSK